MKIIVTGSEGLIGKSICNMFESNGHTVYRLDLSLGHDLTNELFVKNYFSKFTDKADALVNLFALNHHIDNKTSDNNLFNISLNSFKQYLDTNITALFCVCREYARIFKSGSIINFSSTYGIVSPRKDLYVDDEKHIGYSVSKSAVIMLTKHLATHLAPKVRVNTIVPGGVEHEQDDIFKAKYSLQAPMKRMMNVKELYGAVEFLASDRSSYITGTELKVDGGWTSW